MLIHPQFLPQPKPREPKRMLEVTRQEDGSIDVAINYSSLSILQECMRKAQFSLARQLVSTGGESPALTFGTAIHRALEVWYCAPRDSRRGQSKYCDDFQELLGAGQQPPDLLHHGPCVRCAAVARFCVEAPAAEADGSKRSPAAGIRLLGDYFDHYHDDPYVIHADADGPLCERQFEAPLLETFSYSGQPVRVRYHGAIDVVLRNEITGELVVADHKTTSSLGSDFLNRLRPNHQYTGYIWGARTCLGLPEARTFLVNGLLVAKTKSDFRRQLTTREEADFDELRASVEASVRAYLVAAESGVWPQTSPGPCAMWGGCTYRTICEAPKQMQETIARNMYETKPQTETA